MNSIIIIKIGRINIKISGDERILSYLRNYYCNFLCENSREVHFRIDIKLNGFEYDKSYQRIIINSEQRSELYIPQKENYVNVEIEHTDNRCIITLLKNFEWSKNWADWEFSFRLSTFLLFMRSEQLIVHAAGLMFQGRVFLITGESGAGKTTAALNCIKDNSQVMILNDDTVVLYRDCEGDLCVSSSPYQSTSGILPSYGEGRLYGIYQINKSKQVLLCPMKTAHIFQQLWTHCFVVANFCKDYPVLFEFFYAFLKDISAKIRGFHLYVPLEVDSLFDKLYEMSEEI